MIMQTKVVFYLEMAAIIATHTKPSTISHALIETEHLQVRTCLTNSASNL